jgi:hypothetical protein
MNELHPYYKSLTFLFTERGMGVAALWGIDERDYVRKLKALAPEFVKSSDSSETIVTFSCWRSPDEDKGLTSRSSV